MPQAVMHFLVPAILIALFRDFFADKKKFPLHYVLIAGLAGLIPDLDVAVFYLISSFGFTINQVHRTFSHNIFFPMLFVIVGIATLKVRNWNLGKHHLKLSTIIFILAFGITIHLTLDAIFAGYVMPFYPISMNAFGLNLFSKLPEKIQPTIAASIDAALLILWMIYIELKHKISDFI